MKYILPSVLLSLLFFSCLAQVPPAIPPGTPIQVNAIYRAAADFNALPSDGAICNTSGTALIVYSFSKVKVVSTDGTNTTFILTQGYDRGDANIAKINKMYCANTNTFRASVDASHTLGSQLKADIGLLTIPFKFQSSNYLIQPGGSLGGFLGLRYVPAKNTNYGFSTIGFAGLSSVPLNNTSTTNAADIKVVPGLGLGLGAVVTIRNFQIGIIKGWDFYNNDSEKKTNQWLSLSVGYTFIKPAE